MAIADDTHAAYERNAAQFDRVRNKSLLERPWLERFCAGLPRGGKVLDVGCGGGEPIARYLIGQGFVLTGVDFAQPFLDLAASRFPAAEWIAQDMRSLSLGRQFDGVIAWHSFFHLTPDEQRRALPLLAAHAAPGGALMMTVGPEAGETTGSVAEETVYHASLSEAEYRRLFDGVGMSVTAFAPNDQRCGGATVLTARKREAGLK